MTLCFSLPAGRKAGRAAGPPLWDGSLSRKKRTLFRATD